MTRIELKVVRIGNSRGVRLPAGALARYRIGDTVLMEERSDGILLRPRGPVSAKLSWEETAREMARSGEDWSEWDATLPDGLESVPRQAPKVKRVGEPRAGYAPKRRRR
jgi:antitoxin MazE